MEVFPPALNTLSETFRMMFDQKSGHWSPVTLTHITPHHSRLNHSLGEAHLLYILNLSPHSWKQQGQETVSLKMGDQ